MLRSRGGEPRHDETRRRAAASLAMACLLIAIPLFPDALAQGSGASGGSDAFQSDRDAFWSNAEHEEARGRAFAQAAAHNLYAPLDHDRNTGEVTSAWVRFVLERSTGTLRDYSPTTSRASALRYIAFDPPSSVDVTVSGPTFRASSANYAYSVLSDPSAPFLFEARRATSLLLNLSDDVSKVERRGNSHLEIVLDSGRHVHLAIRGSVEHSRVNETLYVNLSAGSRALLVAHSTHEGFRNVLHPGIDAFRAGRLGGVLTVAHSEVTPAEAALFTGVSLRVTSLGPQRVEVEARGPERPATVLLRIAPTLFTADPEITVNGEAAVLEADAEAALKPAEDPDGQAPRAGFERNSDALLVAIELADASEASIVITQPRPVNSGDRNDEDDDAGDLGAGLPRGPDETPAPVAALMIAGIALAALAVRRRG